MIRRIGIAAATAIFMLAIAGCASTPAINTRAVPAQNTEYLIGPGDSLHIFVWDHKDLTTDVQVRPDGKISTPLVENMQAAGKTPSQLGRDLEGVLKQYVRSPVVTVIVQGFVGEAKQQIRVVGAAVKPEALQYRQGMTVLDVVIAVGGLSQYAAGNRARILRNIDGKEIDIPVRLKDLLNKGDIKQNVRMWPGDILVIPESFF